MTPDIVMISGDIADKGLSAEYEGEEKWLCSFGKKLWGSRPEEELPNSLRKRFVFCPRNHDFDMNVCVANVYQFDWQKKKL